MQKRLEISRERGDSGKKKGGDASQTSGGDGKMWQNAD